MTESYRNTAEDASPLPSDPNKAGLFLQELWMAREQHGEKEKSFDDMTDDEREEFKKEYFRRKETEPQFNWLAEMFGSEMAWSQNHFDTNYGKIFWFKFGYGEHDKTEPPHVFVFYPEAHSYENGIILVESSGEWEKSDIQTWKQRYSELHLN